MTNRQLLIDFAKFIAKDEMYSHNENCFTIPGGKTFTSEQLADSFLSTLPSEQGSKQEPYSLLGVASEIGVGCDHEWVCGRITCKCSKCEQIGVIIF